MIKKKIGFVLSAFIVRSGFMGIAFVKSSSSVLVGWSVIMTNGISLLMGHRLAKVKNGQFKPCKT